MVKSVGDYPVTDPYGATYAPWSKSSMHTGDDRACQKNTEVIVGDTVIGTVGMTGKASGYHSHVQRAKAGHYAYPFLNPQGRGYLDTIAFPAKVIEVGYNAEIGNYVRILDANNERWSYFHHTANKVKVGQIISKGGDMKTTLEIVQQMAQTIGGRMGFGGLPNAFDKDQVDLKQHVGEDAGQAFIGWYWSEEAKNFRDKWLPEVVRKAEAYDKLMAADKQAQPDPDGEKWRKLKALNKELLS